MKTRLVNVAALLFPVMVMSQAVPNGTFENWNSTPYHDLDNWQTGNVWSVSQYGLISVTRVTGQSGYAVRMETKIVSGDTAQAYITNSQGDPSQGEGGMPYSQQPTAITGYYRYNLPANDTAFLWLVFKKAGTIIFNQLYSIKGTGSQMTFTSFSFPISLSVVPDSVIFAAVSSNLFSMQGIQNGSFLELDGLTFTGPGITQQLTNNNFENWTPRTYDVLLDWESWGLGFSRTTSSYAGQYAVQLMTMSYGGNEYNSSGITTGWMSDTSGPVGGRPYTLTNDTLCGYYKYTASGGDSGVVYISLSKNGVNVGGGYRDFTASANYAYFEVPIQSGTAPDTLRVDFASSQWPVTASNFGSTLILDNVYLKSSGLGIWEPSDQTFDSYAFPNPSSDIVSINFSSLFLRIGPVHIYNSSGQEVKVTVCRVHSGSLVLDVSALPKGLYYYKVEAGNRICTNSFIKQ